MKLQPKTAIAFRSEEECEVLCKVLTEQGISADEISGRSLGRAYICPEGYWSADKIKVEWSDDPEDFTVDEDDTFEWTYLEAADILRNLIIAERKKNVT